VGHENTLYYTPLSIITAGGILARNSVAERLSWGLKVNLTNFYAGVDIKSLSTTLSYETCKKTVCPPLSTRLNIQEPRSNIH